MLKKKNKEDLIYSRVYLNKDKINDICKEIHYVPVEQTEKKY